MDCSTCKAKHIDGYKPLPLVLQCGRVYVKCPVCDALRVVMYLGGVPLLERTEERLVWRGGEAQNDQA